MAWGWPLQVCPRSGSDREHAAPFDLANLARPCFWGSAPGGEERPRSKNAHLPEGRAPLSACAGGEQVGELVAHHACAGLCANQSTLTRRERSVRSTLR